MKKKTTSQTIAESIVNLVAQALAIWGLVSLTGWGWWKAYVAWFVVSVLIEQAVRQGSAA